MSQAYEAPRQTEVARLRFEISAARKFCKKYTVRAGVFLVRILSAWLSQPVTYNHTVRHSSHAPRGSRITEHVVCVLLQNSHTSLDNTEHVHSFLFSTLSSSHVSHPPLSKHKPCGDLRPHLSGALAEPPSFTGYEPKQLAKKQDHRHFTEDKRFAEHEDLRVNPLFFHRLSVVSTHDTAESIVTPPPDSDSDDEQIRALLASLLYLQEREANADRSQVYHSARENLMSSSSQDPMSTGKLVALFSSKKG